MTITETTSGYRRYMTAVKSLLDAALTEEAETNLVTVARLAADRIADHRVVYVFGASHAGLLVQDLFYRAGGLVPIQPILPRELMLDVKPVTTTTRIEQRGGEAQRFLAGSTLGEGDLLLVVSVSGRNAVPVEMCLEAQARGATVAAITNLAYSRAVTGRGGARLFEVADHVIDLPGVVGDAIIRFDDDLPAVGPVSSTIGAAILHGLMVEVSRQLLDRGIRPPVFASANMDDSDQWNRAQIEAWRGSLDYL